jgi:hypothetical protein
MEKGLAPKAMQKCPGAGKGENAQIGRALAVHWLLLNMAASAALQSSSASSSKNEYGFAKQPLMGAATAVAEMAEEKIDCAVDVGSEARAARKEWSRE